MVSNVKKLLKAFVRRTGYEVIAYTPQRNHELRKAQLLRDHKVNLVVDGGANVGQYAERLRALGYAGRIVSIEPLPKVFAVLQSKAALARDWEVLNYAVGDRDGPAVIHSAANSEVSSLLVATGSQTTRDWTATQPESITVRRLDSLFPSLSAEGHRVYLKLDVQGYERAALNGAAHLLGATVAVELELSTIPLYSGESLMPEMLGLMAGLGFGVFSCVDVLVDYTTGRVLQTEVVFVRDQPQAGPLL